MNKFLLLFSILFVLASCNGSKKVTDQDPFPSGDDKPYSAVDFSDSDFLMPLLQQAKDEGKLVFVDIYTTWCLPCKLMDEDVFSNKDIGKFMNANFISMKIDAEKGNGSNIAAIYETQVFPTLLFLNPNGEVLVRKDGAAFHKELVELGEQALANQ